MQPRRLNGEQSDKNPITILSLCFYCCRQQQIILKNIFPLFLFTEASEMNKGKKFVDNKIRKEKIKEKLSPCRFYL